MDPVIQFLWDRPSDFRELRTSTAFGVMLLERGFESDAILRLAGMRAEDWHWEEELVEQAVRDIGRGELLQTQPLAEAYQAALIEDYYVGKIDGRELIKIGCGLELVFERGRRFWETIAEEASLFGGNGFSPLYGFDRRPFDEALKDALAQNGFPDQRLFRGNWS